MTKAQLEKEYNSHKYSAMFYDRIGKPALADIAWKNAFSCQEALTEMAAHEAQMRHLETDDEGQHEAMLEEERQSLRYDMPWDR